MVQMAPRPLRLIVAGQVGPARRAVRTCRSQLSDDKARYRCPLAMARHSFPFTERFGS